MKLFFLFFLLFSINLKAQENFELKGLKIGADFESVSKQDYECNDAVLEKGLTECRSMDHVTLANKKATIRATMYNYKIDSITVFFNHDDFDDIKSALYEKFGQPKKEFTNVLVNGFGAEFTSLETTWVRNKTRANLTERVGDIDSSMITIYTTDHLKRFSEKQKSKIKENSKDL